MRACASHLIAVQSIDEFLGKLKKIYAYVRACVYASLFIICNRNLYCYFSFLSLRSSSADFDTWTETQFIDQVFEQVFEHQVRPVMEVMYACIYAYGVEVCV